MLRALRHGFGGVGQNWGLVLLVFGVNLGLAVILAAPLAFQLERDLAHNGASASMMYGFDYDWWSRWSEDQEGFPRSFRPDILGVGFAFRNLDLLLRGYLPARLFPMGNGDEPGQEDAGWGPSELDPLILGLGLLYLLVQTFLTGGLLGVFRAPQGGWTFRGLVHGSGFYFGRLLRVSALALGLVGIVFFLSIPLARWADGLARGAVSERTAITLTFGRHALLLLALIAVHMVASFARVIVVREERKSAVLALVSSLGFCVRNPLAVVGQYVAVVVLGLLLLAAWSALDGRQVVLGWRSQLVALVLFQGFVLSRIGLRLGLLASQLELHRARGG
jgi:hypothetical protein